MIFDNPAKKTSTIPFIIMKKIVFKKVYIFFTSLFIFIIHMPFIFAKTIKPGKFFEQKLSSQASPLLVDSESVINPTALSASFKLFDSLRLGSMGMARQAFDCAIKGFNVMKNAGELSNSANSSLVENL